MGRRSATSTRFNPTLVRLRAGSGVGSGVGVKSFQSHAGSIEGTPASLDPARHAPFQSHAGSIEGILLMRLKNLSQQFQSHAGSIEGWDVNLDSSR